MISTTVNGPVGEHLQVGTEDAPVLDCPAPLRHFHDRGAGSKYRDLLRVILILIVVRTYPRVAHSVAHDVAQSRGRCGKAAGQLRARGLPRATRRSRGLASPVMSPQTIIGQP